MNTLEKRAPQKGPQEGGGGKRSPAESERERCYQTILGEGDESPVLYESNRPLGVNEWWSPPAWRRAAERRRLTAGWLPEVED